MERSYSLLEIRAMDDDKRIIEGIATTPQQARDGDILETKGIQFKLPLPFLWRHSEPFGNVIKADVGSTGISVRVQIPPAGTSQAIDEYWRLIKAGVVRGLSIGWRTLQEAFDKEIGGYRIMKSEWLELSAVPVPADANATITSVRSADEAILAALGRKETRDTQRASSQLPRQGQPTGDHPMKNFQSQISELESTRQPKADRMKELMETAQTASREMTAQEGAEYDQLAGEVKKIDKDIDRLREYERISGRVTVVPQTASEEPAKRAVAESVKSNLPKGNLMARAVISLINAGGNRHVAADLAKRYYKDTPEVEIFHRTAIDAGDTTTSGWASQLVPAAMQLQSDFLDLLRPATILGKMTGLRRVPFNVAVPLQSGGGTYNWVGESKPKPVSKLTLSNATLRWAKCAGIIVITKELARFSSPSAEAIVRDDMVQGTARFLDGQFLSASLTESNDHPGGILQGVSAETPSGTTADAFRFDLNVLFGNFIGNSQNPATAVIIMSATTAAALSLMVNALGQQEFPGITVNGGTISGLPVIVSETAEDRVILVNQSDILLADDGGVSIDVSEQASIEMSDDPIGGEESPVTGAILHSLWQRNEIGLRVERFISWKRARTSAVEYQDNVTYTPTQPGSPA